MQATTRIDEAFDFGLHSTCGSSSLVDLLVGFPEVRCLPVDSVHKKLLLPANLLGWLLGPALHHIPALSSVNLFECFSTKPCLAQPLVLVNLCMLGLQLVLAYVLQKLCSVILVRFDLEFH